jgi:hypothetical protein
MGMGMPGGGGPETGTGPKGGGTPGEGSIPMGGMPGMKGGGGMLPTCTCLGDDGCLSQT